MPGSETFWEDLDPRYRLILCDVWGVVHDGYRLYPGAADRLRQWRSDGRFVVLITNAPRTSHAVEQHLLRVGLPREAWHAIATSGDAGIAAVKALGEPVGFLGTAADRAILVGEGVQIRDDDGFSDLACTGLAERRWDVEDYRADLALWAERGIRFHCLNPDRVVIHGGVPMVCAGALADEFEKMGGKVAWYGKPHPAIYDHALHLAGDPTADEVLAVGDGLQTDILGAARKGFDAVFVTGGIHGGEPFPQHFASENSLGEWHPVAVVEGLG